ncbi:MAG: YdbL family protein [Immundisolibacteraceae bacterium]|nr:YdbL family protein [Immundisolibacteraceae bacterium]
MTVRRISFVPLLFLLTACVTINIYFPAAAAEKAADAIIKEILDAGVDSQLIEPQSRVGKPIPAWIAGLEPAINWLVPPAQAAGANLNVKSAAIDQLRASMKQRFIKLKPHFTAGALGLTTDGLVALRDVSALPLSQRAKLNPLLAAENRDRKALYQALARANDHPEWQAQIRATFASRWIKNAPNGWWYQAGGGWQQK